MNEQSDAELLRAYAVRQDEAAFRELVLRHTDFVYSAALRQVQSSAAAADIAQSVFVALAQESKEISDKNPGNSLSGWLHRATRYRVLNHLRDTHRRHENERQAMEQLITDSDTAIDWQQIRPALDEALDSLADDDREAILLRYFKNQDFRSLGLALGISDDTAQKRVSRAVERLREFFSRRGISVTAGGLAVAVSSNAVHAAPAGLSAAISSTALASGAISTATIVANTTKAIAMTTLQKTLVTATIAVLAGAGVYEARQTAQLREQVQSSEQRQAPLTEEIQKLQSSLAEATNRLAELGDDNQKMRTGTPEILKLRNEIGTLKQQTNSLGKLVKTLSTALTASNTPLSELGQTNYPRTAWTFSGFGSAEDTLKSFMWAKINGDVTKAFASATPELSAQLKDYYFKGKSDAEISALLIESSSHQQGMQIMRKMTAADDQVIYQVHIEGEAPKSYTLLTLRNLDGEWKVSGVDERPEEPAAAK